MIYNPITMIEHYSQRTTTLVHKENTKITPHFHRKNSPDSLQQIVKKEFKYEGWGVGGGG